MESVRGMETDCRKLFFQIEFCHVPKERVKDSAIDFYHFIEDFFQGKFITLWAFYHGNKTWYPKDIVSLKEFSDPFTGEKRK